MIENSHEKIGQNLTNDYHRKIRSKTISFFLIYERL